VTAALLWVVDRSVRGGADVVGRGTTFVTDAGDVDRHALQVGDVGQQLRVVSPRVEGGIAVVGLRGEIGGDAVAVHHGLAPSPTSCNSNHPLNPALRIVFISHDSELASACWYQLYQPCAWAPVTAHPSKSKCPVPTLAWATPAYLTASWPLDLARRHQMPTRSSAR